MSTPNFYQKYKLTILTYLFDLIPFCFYKNSIWPIKSSQESLATFVENKIKLLNDNINYCKLPHSILSQGVESGTYATYKII